MRLLRTAVAVGWCGALLVSTAAAFSAEPPPTQPITHVIVVARANSIAQAERDTLAHGGTIQRTLGVIGGFSATLPADQVGALGSSDAIAAVSPDRSITPMSVDPTLGYDPASTTSLSAISQIVGAQSMWNAGFTGAGVDVAVIDTGVSRVAGLSATGKVVNGPDLSFDAIEPTLVGKDAFGHGTHMAGIIAGSDVPAGAGLTGCKTCLGKSLYTDTTKFEGIAPGARVISVKVGAFDGATDVSQVIAGIDWVVQHRKDAGFNIRVINLSFGTDSTQSVALDPLVYAAEMAWKAGIVVVTAAGNDGMLTSSLADPALSPAVIAVGASDPQGTMDTADDTIPWFAQHGNSAREVDVVAPGVSVISLRVPGGFVDQNVTTGKVGTRFQQATGTSQATAVVSGLAALLLSKFPTATPDQIKAYLRSTAMPVTLLDMSKSFGSFLNQLIKATNSWYSGTGSAWVGSAAKLGKLPTVAAATLGGTGLGTLEGARGSYHVSADGVELNGEQDIFGSAWVAKTMAAATAACATWTGGVWNGARWTGDTWSAGAWTNVAWTGARWSSGTWSGARWTAMVWGSAGWTGARWTGARWSSGTWSGARWSGARWSDDGWS
jgi:serine protease AprX